MFGDPPLKESRFDRDKKGEKKAEEEEEEEGQEEGHRSVSVFLTGSIQNYARKE